MVSKRSTGLSKELLEHLKKLREYGPFSPASKGTLWKEEAMAELVERGYAQKVVESYVLSEKGKALLAELKKLIQEQ